MNRVAGLVLVAGVLTAVPLGAQPSFQATLGPALESVQPAGDVRQSQGNLAGGGTFEYLFAGERARVFYDLAAGSYATPGDWRTLIQEFGGRYRFDLGASDAHHVFAGSSAVLRRNGESWNAADYNALGAFVNLELHPSATAAIRTGYRVDLRRFPTYAPLDQDEQRAFASGLVNLQSRTTVVGEVVLGAKHYNGVAGTAAQSFSPASTSAGAVTGAGRGSGAARGAHAGILAPVAGPVIVGGTAATNAGLVTVFGRVAQSIAARTSVSTDVSWRDAFGNVPPAVVMTPAGFFDDGVYDDPYASDAREARVSIKSLAWRAAELWAFASWQDKRYGATPALDVNGTVIDGVLRNDRVARAGARMTIPVASVSGPFDVDVLCGYDFTRDRSTTAAYNYTSHAVTVGLQLAY